MVVVSVEGEGLPHLVLLLLSPSAEQWEAANQEPVDRNQFKVKGLPVGEKMLFRVVAVNIAGRSPPASLAHPVTIREIVGQSAATASCCSHPPGPTADARCSVPSTSQSTPRSASRDT